MFLHGVGVHEQSALTAENTDQVVDSVIGRNFTDSEDQQIHIVHFNTRNENTLTIRYPTALFDERIDSCRVEGLDVLREKHKLHSSFGEEGMQLRRR